MSETPRYTDKETGRSTPHAQEIADILGQRQELKDIITQNNFPKKNELNWGNEGSPYEIKASDTKGVLEILKNTDGFNAKSQLNDTRYVQIAYWNMMTHMKTLPAQDANGKFYDVNSIEAGDKIFVKNGFLHFKRKEGSSFADFEVPIYPWDVTLPSADKETETAPDLRKVGQELKIEEAIASGLIVQDETGDWNPIEGYEFIDPSDTSANWGVKPKEQAQAPVETQSSPEQKWNESVQKIVNDFKDKTVEPGRSENPFGPNLTGGGVSFAEAGGWTSFDPVVKGSENWTSDQITRAIKDLNKEWVKTHPAAAPEAPATAATETDFTKVGQELKREEAIANGLVVKDETGDWNPIEGYEFIEPSETSANWGVKPKEQAQAPVETQSSPEQKWNESVQKTVNDFKDKTVEPGRSENPFGPNLTGDGVSFAEAGGWTSFDPVVKGSENWTSDQITRAIKDLNKEWVKTHPAAAPEAPAGPATEPAAPAATEPAAAPTAPAAAAGTGPKYPLPEY